MAGPRVEPPADDAPLESFVDDLLVDLDEELASDDIDEGAPARDGSARARAASRRPAAPRPDDAPFVWTLPGGGYGGYADALASVAEDGAAAGGVEMHVQAIPRALDYHLARATQELERAGFEGEELRQRLVKVHRRHRRDDDLTLFRVRLTPAGGGVHHFLQNKLTRHFEVSLEGRTKSFALVSVDAKPVFEHWAVFEYPPNQPRRYRPRVPLGKIGRMEIVIGVRLDAESSVPVDIRFAGLVRSEQTRDPANSINLPKRQISCVEWDQCVVPTLSVRFFPGRWDEPSPPEGFRELVGELGR